MPKSKTILNISLLLLFSLNLSCQDRMVNILYVLPQNYEGPIVVLYGQKDGKPKEYYNNDWRVYRINKYGTLKTQFEYERKSYLNMRFCYENKETKDWMKPVYIYDYEYKPDLCNSENNNYLYVHLGPTEIHHCGFSSYQFCSFSINNIKNQANYFLKAYLDIKKQTYIVRMDSLVNSLRSPCK